MSASEPALSAILVTDTFDTIRDTVRHLDAQTARGRIELVVVTSRVAELQLDEGACESFAAVRVVEAEGDLVDIAHMRAVGVRAASAPVVLLGETHSFPDPSSVEALIEAHRGPWAAVGQAMWNGNPKSMTSWTNQYLDYGAWTGPCPAGVVDLLPTHNVSFKRDALLERADDPAKALRSSQTLCEVLRDSGPLFLEAAARTFHINVSRTRSWVPERAAAGRAYAGVRSEGWPWWRRATYSLGAPLIPAVRLRRVLRDINRTDRTSQLVPRILPMLVLGLLVSAVGESVGFAFGPGNASRRVGEMELHRRPHIRDGDWPPAGESRGAS